MKVVGSTPAGSPDASGRGSRHGRQRPGRDRTSRRALFGLAPGFVLLCMLQAPGRVAADTKMDVLFEPATFLARATHLWHSNSDFGFLPNQYIGYLFPMGPFFALGKLLAVPPWITQRLWMALLLTVAAWGLVRLADALRIGTPATRILAGVAYAASPMFLGKIGSTSVALLGATMLPWIVLPLVLALWPPATAAATRLSPRRAAAASGLAVLATGGVNASVTLCVLLLPAVLLVLAGNTRRAWALRGWWATAVVFATAWWVLALLLQGIYGLNFLPYTETAQTTTSTTSLGETIRGTTDWMAYLRLPEPWLPAATDYVAMPAAIVGSALVAAIGLFGLARADLPARRFLVVGAAAGFVAVAAAYPGQPGGLLADGIREQLSLSLAFLRNVYKFQPVVRVPLALGLAHALAVAAAVLARRASTAQRLPDRARRAAPHAAAFVALAAVAVGMTPALAGRAMPPGPFGAVPDYWVEAADWLADNPTGGRTLLLPGTAFAEYGWGRPLDEPLQWLSATPWGVRSLIPLGGVGVTRWMDEIERQLSLGSAPGLGPALARAGVGQVVVRNDLHNKDWDIPPSSEQVRRALESSDLVREAAFGPMVPARTAAKSRLVDEAQATGKVPSLEVWTVPGGASQVHAYPAETAMLVSGGPEATVQLAGQGLLGIGRAVVLAADLAGVGPGPDPVVDSAAVVAAPPAPDAPPVSELVGPATPWVVTDTLDRRDHQFGLVHNAASYLLGPTEAAPGSSRQPQQWADRPLGGHQTVAAYADGMSVTASSYGSDLLRTPEQAPFNAVDGLTDTAWQARRQADGGSAGQWITLDVGRQVEVGKVTVRLLQETTRRPAVQALRVTTQAGSIVTPVAANEEEQDLDVPSGPTRWFRVSFEELTREDDPVLGAGIREIVIPGVAFRRYFQTPSDLAPVFAEPGSGPLVYSFDRERVDPSTPFGGDEERAIARRFELPRAGAFRLTGAAMYLVPDDPSRLPPGQTPLDTGCGGGPAIVIDGVGYPTRITGSWADVPALRPLPLTLCTLDGSGVVALAPGRHQLSVEQHPVYQTVDSIRMTDVAMDAAPAGPRFTRVTSWSPEQRRIEIGAGERALLAVKENANPSWTATLGGQTLTPIRLDGWQQGWIVPAGEGGTIMLENGPGVSYRRNLLVGLLLVGLLLIMLVVPDRYTLRPRSDPDGTPALLQRPAAAAFAARLERLPAWFWPAALATLTLALVAAPAALALPALVVAGRRWPAALPLLAFAAAVAAGMGVAVEPDRLPGSGEGAFSVAVQTAGALGIAAVLASFILSAIAPPGRGGREAGAGGIATRMPEQPAAERVPEPALAGTARRGPAVVALAHHGEQRQAGTHRRARRRRGERAAG